MSESLCLLNTPSEQWMMVVLSTATHKSQCFLVHCLPWMKEVSKSHRELYAHSTISSKWLPQENPPVLLTFIHKMHPVFFSLQFTEKLNLTLQIKEKHQPTWSFPWPVSPYGPHIKGKPLLYQIAIGSMILSNQMFWD